MRPKHRQPQWWQLYLGLPLLCGLYVPEMRLYVPQTEHVVLQLGILAVIFIFLRVWLRANAQALRAMDLDALVEPGAWRMRLYTLPPAEPADGRSFSVSRAQPCLPEVEVKGVLETTFEWHREDELITIDPVEHTVGKE
jgi:hypothetical protein